MNDSRGALLNIGEAERAAGNCPMLATLVKWVDSYPMNPHPDLGRGGAVCPYTRLAKRNDTIRFRVLPYTALDEAMTLSLVRDALSQLANIPAATPEQHLQVIILGFPHCDSAAGVAMLHRVMKRLRWRAMFSLRMMGLMYPGAESGGLWNPEFRPLAAPMPVIAVRRLVESDAPFISRQHLQWVPYLLRYGLGGAKRLASYRRYASRRARLLEASRQPTR